MAKRGIFGLIAWIFVPLARKSIKKAKSGQILIVEAIHAHPLMNLLYKAAALWILSLVAAGPIPLALHVAICHEHGEAHAAAEPCSHHHDHHSHAHAGHSHVGHSHSDHEVALTGGGHDHDCGVCQTLSQSASVDSVCFEANSQLLVQPASVATGDVYLSAARTAYQGRGPPCSLLV